MILGLDYAGSTTLYSKLIGYDKEVLYPTKTYNGANIQCCGMNVNIYAPNGRFWQREFWKYFYHDINALIYVIDRTDDIRIEETNEIFQDLMKEKNLSNIPVLIFLNKCDREDCLFSNDIIDDLGLKEIKGRHWCIEACNALKGWYIKNGMKWLFEELSE